MNILDIAKGYLAVGINLLPVKHDGSKAPAPECLDDNYSWKYLQSRMPTDEELPYFFSNGNGIAAVGGRISGNLEDLDFDHVPTFILWRALIIEHLGQDFWSNLLIVKTPRPGRAVIYRCSEGVGNSQKLASKPDEPKTIVETKAEGGYFLLPGCPGACHNTGRMYELVQGSFDHIPELSASERDIFLGCARSFDQMPKIAFETPRDYRLQEGEILPGQDFEQRGPSIEQLLQDGGWKIWKTFSDKTWWTRPEKQAGPSGSTNGLYFYPFTTSTEFDANRAYGKFAVFTILNHAGDFHAAAKALYAEGFGSRLETSHAASQTDTRTKPITQPGEENLENTTIEEEAAALARVMHSPTEDNVALLFERRYGSILRYCKIWGFWFEWDGTRWHPEHTDLAIDFCRRLSRSVNVKGISSIARRSFSNGVEAYARAARVFATLPDLWDSDDFTINMPRGTEHIGGSECESA